MNWELEQVTERIECTIDDSGIYTVINRTVANKDIEYVGQEILIRVDILATDGDTPLRSFVGPGNDVRKRVVSYLSYQRDGMLHAVSHEHASYIGYEIARAIVDENYVQD